MYEEILNDKIRIKYFKNKFSLCNALLINFTRILNLYYSISRKATIGLSGGDTPKLFYKILFNSKFLKKNFNIILVDDRIVDNDSPISNFNLIKNSFKIKHREAILELNERNYILNTKIKKNKPFDLILLGMGLDGHIASIFDHNKIDKKISNDRFENIKIIKKKNENFKRVSLSLEIKKNSRRRFLFIRGTEKLMLFKKLVNIKDLKIPISNILNEDLTVYWSPN